MLRENTFLRAIFFMLRENIFFVPVLPIQSVQMLKEISNLSRDMRFPTMWYGRPAKAQTSLRISAV